MRITFVSGKTGQVNPVEVLELRDFQVELWDHINEAMLPETTTNNFYLLQQIIKTVYQKHKVTKVIASL